MRKILVASLAVLAAATAPAAAHAREGAAVKVAGPGIADARDGAKRVKPILRHRPVRAGVAVRGYFEG